jgi:hypothetical protein
MPLLRTPAAITSTPSSAHASSRPTPAAVQQRVTAGHQDAIDAVARDPLELHRVVHAGADRSHHALVAQLAHGGQRLAQGLLHVVLGVVHEQHVDTIEPQPLRLSSNDRSTPSREKSNTTSPSRISRPTLVESTYSSRGRSASAAPSRRSDSPLRSIQRRDVEEADAGVPRGVDRRPRVLLAHRRIEPAERSASQPEPHITARS